MIFTPSRYQGPSLLDGTEFDDDENPMKWLRQINVEWRGSSAPDHSKPYWAITDTALNVYGRDGECDVMEPQPSSRTDKWKSDHRFTFDEAMELIRNNWSKWQERELQDLRRLKSKAS